LLLSVEVQRAGDQAASSCWASAKGVIGEGHRYLGIYLQGWGVSGSAVHSSPLLPEYVASALISLEIKFTSVLLHVHFLEENTVPHLN
jgi:hypothetical protein